MELGQERDVLLIGREFQYRVRMLPLAPVNVRIQNPNQFTYIREGAIARANNTQETLAHPTLIMQMRILAWNSRGASGNQFITEARNFIQRFQPQVFIVMETKLLSEQAQSVANNLFYENSVIVSSTNYAGGIWVLWNSNQITLSQIQVTSRSMLW